MQPVHKAIYFLLTLLGRLPKLCAKTIIYMCLECRVSMIARIFMTMRESLNSMKQKVATWLMQGITPRRLAFTLSLGFAIGCIPVVGIPTFACVALALALRLNLPAIQAANYLVMPLQLILIVP